MIIIDTYVKKGESHLRNLMSYRGQLVASQNFIKGYVRKRIFNESDALDIVQEVNRVALEKEGTYNKEYTFFGVKNNTNTSADGTTLRVSSEDKDPSGVNAIPQVTIFRKWISGICRFQVMAFLTSLKRSKLEYMEDIYSIHNPTYTNPIPSVSLIKKEISDEFDNSLTILSGRERDVLSLLKRGYKQVEISKELSIQPCHVSAYKSRAIIKIKNNHASS